MAAASPSSSMIIVDYELKSRIGGDRSPSSIWRAIDRSNGQDVILKKIPLAGLTRNLRDSLYFELNFLANVLHPSIVPLLDVLKVDGYVFLVLEFCEGGDLAAFVKRNGRLRESVVGRFMAQLGEGLEVLQAHHIIHRDLKPEVENLAIGYLLKSFLFIYAFDKRFQWSRIFFSLHPAAIQY